MMLSGVGLKKETRLMIVRLLQTMIVSLCLVGFALGQDERENIRAEMVKAARETYEACLDTYNLGRGSPEEVYRWSQRWYESEVLANPEKRLDALKKHLDRMTKLISAAKRKVAAGSGRPQHVSAALWYQLEARLWLQQLEAPKDK